jgi:copper oxidase (laccase) domain-containing protein
MASAVITVPSFAPNSEGVEHFFGTRLSSVSMTPGRPFVPQVTRGDRTGASVIVSVKQVHGTDALVVDQPIRQGESFDGGWDALVTNQPGVMVTVRTADCVPVLLHDPVQRVVAAVHAGWRGAVAGIVPKTVAYEVDEPVLSRLREVFPEWREVVKPVGTAKAHLDLRAFVRRQGLVNGVQEERIATVNACTICHPDLFFSYRREGVVKATMISGIALLPQS